MAGNHDAIFYGDHAIAERILAITGWKPRYYGKPRALATTSFN
jgi:hypothetical protein